MFNYSGGMGFLGWTLVGATGAFGVLALLTIGLPFVVLAGVLAAVLLRRGVTGQAGLLSGAGLPILYVAWLNRAGPGDVCHVEATYTQCSDTWNPYPILAVGLMLLIAGPLLLTAARAPFLRGSRRPDRS